MARDTVPVVGHVTETVAMSPTEELNGVYWVTKQTAVNAGLVADAVPEVGLTTTVALLPRSGQRVAST